MGWGLFDEFGGRGGWIDVVEKVGGVGWGLFGGGEGGGGCLVEGRGARVVWWRGGGRGCLMEDVHNMGISILVHYHGAQVVHSMRMQADFSCCVENMLRIKRFPLKLWRS